MKIPNQFLGSNMEENTPCNTTNGSLGPEAGASGAPSSSQAQNKPDTDEKKRQPQYSIPGILHFIQHEWARFEMERSQWEVDRAELQARIAFLQGERKGQENLKHDLIRRIKMLEFALKQERAKFNKLKYGTEMPALVYCDESSEGSVGLEAEPYEPASNVTWRQGRQLLRQYLQEIGYTDTIIDVRSNRVRSLLGLNNNADAEENLNNAGSSVNGNEGSNKRASESQGRQTIVKKPTPSSLTEAMILETEAAIMANFDYLGHNAIEMDEEDIPDDLDDQPDDEDVKMKRKKKGINDSMANDVDAEAEEVLNELNLLSESVGEDEGVGGEWGQRIEFAGGIPSRHHPIADDNIDCNLLGDLAQLTVNNEAEPTYDVANTKESFRKTWSAKYTLRSHFDCVRALAFHPHEPVLITASDDNTLKLWNLEKTVPAKKSTSLDVEPLYTFRSHTGPVLSVAVDNAGSHCYSGGLDGAIRCWHMPDSGVDPYDLFNPRVLTQSLSGHKDAIWDLRTTSHLLHLLSCSADGTVKFWSTDPRDGLLNTFTSEQDGIPTSVDSVCAQEKQIVVSYNSSNCVIFDTETGKAILRLESSQEGGNSTGTVYRVVSHPVLPITITAHEDRNIRFFDNNTGKLVHSMVAHLDAVTSLAVDPHGLFLLSGSHDCSIRLWNLDNKTCVQEITAHRKKFDESILDVAFHPSRPYIASAGADGLAKVFV